MSEFDSISNPFSLDCLCGPDALLVSTILSVNNYIPWSRAMIIALCARNKFGFVNGSISIPSPEDPLFPEWKEANALVLSWLCNSIDKDIIIPSLSGGGSAAGVWDYLHDSFSPKSGHRIYHLQHAIASHRQGKDTVAIYFNKLKNLWEELSKGITTISSKDNGEYHQVQQLMQFLMGLNQTNDNIRTKILSMNPLPSVNHAFDLVVLDESQRHLIATNNVSTNSVLVGSNLSQDIMTSDHLRLICAHCELSNHTIEKCYNLQGYPPNHFAKEAWKEGEVEHYSHKHPLKYFFNESNEDTCSACGELSSGPTYRCSPCGFILHKLCAEVPQVIHHPDHQQHPLTFVFKVPYYGDQYECNVCHARSASGFHFNCAICQFGLDINCVLQGHNNFNTEKSKSKRCIKQYEEKGHINKEVENVEHQHPLVLLYDKLEKTKFLCSWCHQLLSGSVYGCTLCPYYLHKLCYKSSRKIKHPYHDHALNLLPRIPNTLFRRAECYCKACDSLIEGTGYGCERCRIFLHVQCALLPHQVDYRRDDHPLKLIYSIIDDGSDEYYCDICEERLYEKWVYYCDICNYTSHLACVNAEALSPRRTARIQSDDTDSRKVKSHNNNVPRDNIICKHVPCNDVNGVDFMKIWNKLIKKGKP